MLLRAMCGSAETSTDSKYINRKSMTNRLGWMGQGFGVCQVMSSTSLIRWDDTAAITHADQIWLQVTSQ